MSDTELLIAASLVCWTAATQAVLWRLKRRGLRPQDRSRELGRDLRERSSPPWT